VSHKSCVLTILENILIFDMK